MLKNKHECLQKTHGSLLVLGANTKIYLNKIFQSERRGNLDVVCNNPRMEEKT